MWSDRRGGWFWISAWLPVLLGITMIVIESTEWMGADHTSTPLRLVYQAIFGRVTDLQWESVHHILRKSGHFIGYGLIGLAWLRAWWMTLPQSNFLPDAFFALVGTALIASADEFHQSFLSNRTSTPAVAGVSLHARRPPQEAGARLGSRSSYLAAARLGWFSLVGGTMPFRRRYVTMFP
jgi:VanZ family protein